MEILGLTLACQEGGGRVWSRIAGTQQEGKGFEGWESLWQVQYSSGEDLSPQQKARVEFV